ncbi:MAG: ABC transporter substrate-binding protein, partial [Lachnospiraceae bacterium]|nr:ABC transporter substrate-binding protein [Lachnospiraceae bacterium]
MKKKLLALLVSAAMVYSLAGCGNSTGGAADNTSAASGNDAAQNNVAENNAPADNAQTEVAPADTEGDTYNVGICQLVQHDALDAATQGFKDAL